MVCLALELVVPSVVLNFSVGMEAFAELLSINVPWSQEFSGVLNFGFKPPAFQSYSYLDFSIHTALMIKLLG